MVIIIAQPCRLGRDAWNYLALTQAFFSEYVISMPNMYARGILWGKMVLELGDSCTAKNENNGFFADLQFKTKVNVLSFFSPHLDAY